MNKYEILVNETELKNKIMYKMEIMENDYRFKGF